MDLKAQRDRFLAFAFASADLLIETDAEGRIGFALGAGSLLGRKDAHDLVGLRIADAFAPADRPLVAQLVASIRPGRRFGPVSAKPEGGAGPVFVSACTLPSSGAARFFAVSADQPAAPAAAAAPRDEAGLVTARAFAEVATETLARLRERGRDVAMTLVDLPDEASLLAKLDEAAQSDYRGKVGAILRSVATGDAASQVADGRYSLVHEAALDTAHVFEDLREASVAADPDGVGIAVHGQTIAVEDDLSAADAAKALAYTVSTFAEGGAAAMNLDTMGAALDGLMRDTSAKMVAFKRAIADRKVGFVAQPVVCLSSRKTTHYELLVRFEAGKSPFEMVAFAEKTGIIAELDMAVLEVAGAFLARSAPPKFPGLAVNVSGLSVTNPMFVSRLWRKLSDFRFDVSKLVFEITESAEITDLAAADDTIRRIRKLGYQVCLDDFGAGAASFPYLRALDVDGVKIDGGYVREALASRRDGLLLKAMAALCKDLGVTTIAEMVETEDQVNFLKSLGIQKGQGWLFGKPAPLQKLAAAAAA